VENPIPRRGFRFVEGYGQKARDAAVFAVVYAVGAASPFSLPGAVVIGIGLCMYILLM
jgi:hypothetical protein